jgi:hypothetical protein
MDYVEWKKQNTDRWNQILNDLRESGEINMFGAPRWLMDNYGLEKSEANEIFTTWTKTFEEDS